MIKRGDPIYLTLYVLVLCFDKFILIMYLTSDLCFEPSLDYHLYLLCICTPIMLFSISLVFLPE